MQSKHQLTAFLITNAKPTAVFYNLAVDSKSLNLVENLLYKHPIDVLPKSTFNGKIKVSVQKVTAAFGSASGLAINVAQYADRNWRSVWLILSPQEYSWFIFGRVYRKKQIKPQVIKVPDDSQDQKMVAEAATWIKNNDRNLKYSDREILLGESTSLNDNLLDSAQKVTCKSLGNLAS